MIGFLSRHELERCYRLQPVSQANRAAAFRVPQLNALIIPEFLTLALVDLAPAYPYSRTRDFVGTRTEIDTAVSEAPLERCPLTLGYWNDTCNTYDSI